MKIVLVLLMSLVLSSCFGDNDDVVRDGTGKIVKKVQPQQDGVIAHIEHNCRGCGSQDAMCCQGACRAILPKRAKCQPGLHCESFPNGSDICR
jgi:hypothetical protein